MPRHARRGAAAVIVALCIVPLTGLLAMAVDVGMLYRERRNAQIAADAAAMAYVQERVRGATDANARAVALAQADTNGFRDGYNRATVTPTTVTWSTTTNAIKIEVKDTVPTLFAGIFRRAKIMVYASAVATYDLDANDNCLYALESSATSALDIDNNGDVTASCGLVVNSTSTSALRMGNNATLTASSVSLTGNYSGSGNITGTVRTGVAPAPSPAAAVPDPTVGSCTATNYSIGNNATATISPGTYCNGITLGNNATLHLNTGTYVLKGGNLSLGNGAEVISNAGGVTIALMPSAGGVYGTLDIGNNATLTLSSPTTGTYAGILIYKPAAAPDVGITLSNGSTGSLNGSFYTPSQTLTVKQGGTITVVGAIAAKKVKVEETAHLVLSAPTSTTSGYYAFKRATLVE